MGRIGNFRGKPTRSSRPGLFENWGDALPWLTIALVLGLGSWWLLIAVARALLR
jgi:hypothetical protein